jgi:hypothetical protein
LYEAGIPLVTFVSRRGQWRGENRLGLEIKYDGQMARTGNVYFETHEKSAADQPLFVESGILRRDNTWLYAIGDYSVLYILSLRVLRKVYERECICVPRERKARFVETATSRGFLIRTTFVETITEKEFHFIPPAKTA